MVKTFVLCNLWSLMIIGCYGDGVSDSSRSSTPATLASDPVTCPIIPGCETTIDISKGRTGLGLSIVGGCDTLLVSVRIIWLYLCKYIWVCGKERALVIQALSVTQGAIIIHEVYEEGAAAKDGRLWAGDQILEVMFNLKS